MQPNLPIRLSHLSSEAKLEKSESQILLRKFIEIEGDKYKKREQCEKILPYLTKLDKHLNASHSDDQPEICLERTSNFENLLTSQTDRDSYAEQNHVEKHEDSTKNVCNVCLLEFKLEDDLTKHMPKHLESAILPSILKKL